MSPVDEVPSDGNAKVCDHPVERLMPDNRCSEDREQELLTQLDLQLEYLSPEERDELTRLLRCYSDVSSELGATEVMHTLSTLEIIARYANPVCPAV